MKKEILKHLVIFLILTVCFTALGSSQGHDIGEKDEGGDSGELKDRNILVEANHRPDKNNFKWKIRKLQKKSKKIGEDNICTVTLVEADPKALFDGPDKVVLHYGEDQILPKEGNFPEPEETILKKGKKEDQKKIKNWVTGGDNDFLNGEYKGIKANNIDLLERETFNEEKDGAGGVQGNSGGGEDTRPIKKLKSNLKCSAENNGPVKWMETSQDKVSESEESGEESNYDPADDPSIGNNNGEAETQSGETSTASDNSRDSGDFRSIKESDDETGGETTEKGISESTIKKDLRKGKERGEVIEQVEVEKNGEIGLANSFTDNIPEKADMRIFFRWRSDQVGFESENFGTTPGEVKDLSNWMLMASHGHADFGVPLKKNNNGNLVADLSKAKTNWKTNEETPEGAFECDVMSEYGGSRSKCDMPLGHYKVKGLIKQVRGENDWIYYDMINVFDVSFEIVNKKADITGSDLSKVCQRSSKSWHDYRKCVDQKIIPTCSESNSDNCKSLMENACPGYVPQEREKSLDDLEAAKCGMESQEDTEDWVSVCEERVDGFDLGNRADRKKCLNEEGFTDDCKEGIKSEAICKSASVYAEKSFEKKYNVQLSSSFNPEGEYICKFKREDR